jgi:hypothetical protein
MEAISPKYLMKLIKNIEFEIWAEYKTYENVRFYIEKWHVCDEDWNNYSENFHIYLNDKEKIKLTPTLHNIPGDLLLKMAIDLGVETPDFIPSIPVFRNDIKSTYPTASATFEKAFKQIEDQPDITIGLANSALESIIKEILKDDRIHIKLNGNETLYALTTTILKGLRLLPNSEIPKEIKTIGNSLLSACQGIESMRSDKTNFHGKTSDDYVVNDPLYAYFVVNSISTVGLFLKKYYECKFPRISTPASIDTEEDIDYLPF